MERDKFRKLVQSHLEHLEDDDLCIYTPFFRNGKIVVRVAELDKETCEEGPKETFEIFIEKRS